MIHIDAKHFKLLQENIYELSGIAIVDSKFAMANCISIICIIPSNKIDLA